MITTVTTTTVTTITSIAAMGLAATLGIVISVTLIAFLTGKELAGATSSPGPKLISRYLSVPIIPMLMIFGAIVCLKIVEIMA